MAKLTNMRIKQATIGFGMGALSGACSPDDGIFTPKHEEAPSYEGPGVYATANGMTEFFALEDSGNIGDRIFRVTHPTEDRPTADAQFLKHTQDDMGRNLLAVLVNSTAQPPEDPETEAPSFVVIKDVDGQELYRAELPFSPHHTFSEIPPELSVTREDGASSVVNLVVIGWGEKMENGDTADHFNSVHIFEDGAVETKLAWSSSELPNWDKVASGNGGQAMHSNGLDCNDAYNMGTVANPDMRPVCTVTALVPSVVYMMDLNSGEKPSLIWDSSTAAFEAAGLSIYAPHSPDLTTDGKLSFFNDGTEDDPNSYVVELRPDVLNPENTSVLSVIETEGQKTRGAVTVLDQEHVLITHSANAEFCVEDIPVLQVALNADPETPAYGRSTYENCAASEQAGGGILRAYFVPDMYWQAPEL